MKVINSLIYNKNHKQPFRNSLHGLPVVDLNTPLDISRAIKVLGWQPEISLEDGLAVTVEVCKTFLDRKEFMG